MTKSIPMDFVASVTPAVEAVEGSAVDIVGVVLTQNTLLPAGEAMEFVSDKAVGAFFGTGSAEYAYAEGYFAGDDDATQTPATLYFVRYPEAAIPAFLLGATGASLAALQAITAGSITLEVNGASLTSANVNLSAAGSFSAVAAALQTALAHNDAAFTGAIAGNVLTVSAVASGALAVGQAIADTAGNVPAGVTILEQLTGTAGEAGTYQLSSTFAEPVSAETMTAGALTVAYLSTPGAFVITTGTPGTADSITVANTGALATAMGLTAAAGATASPGAAAATPGAFMDGVVNEVTDWATFTTLWEPVSADKVVFFQWTDAQGDNYAYVCWSTEAEDVDPNATSGSASHTMRSSSACPTTSARWPSASTSRRVLISPTASKCPASTYAPVNLALKAAFIMGAAACINFEEANGRRNFSYLKQASLSADVTDKDTAAVLKAKRINFYGKLSSKKNSYNREMFGFVSGEFLWMDSYINQIWLNSNLQEDLFLVLDTYPNIPYNTEGYSYISEGLGDTISTALSFGAIQTGITLTAAQANAVNTKAGTNVSSVLETEGWALVIQAATGTIRSGRGSPPIYFFYTDGESVNTLNLTSTEVQ